MAGSDSRSGRRWMGAGMCAAGLLFVVVPWLMLASMQGDHDEAVAQQAWVQGQCVVTEAAIVEIPQKDGGTPDETLEVTFDLVAGDRRVEGLSYTYPRYASADPNLHRPGAQVSCWYDGRDLGRAVLMRKAAPREPRPAVGFVHIVFAAIGLLVLAGGVWSFFLAAAMRPRRQGA